ncbi:hypothetical protein MKW94_024597 [Papaver nudicaule]|uniref:Uncharacterized protein n=1 Tax=Papaver nudicaule TaxID=74823 RepID=A0AA41SCC5_PAPNU|nr:hypothetical protein [Papaver nudicaule]
MLAQGDASSSSGDDVGISNCRNKCKSAAASSPDPRKRNAIGRAAAMSKNEDRFSTSTCIEVLDEMSKDSKSLTPSDKLEDFLINRPAKVQ